MKRYARKLQTKHKSLLESNHKCSRCGCIGHMTYAEPYLCEDCSIEIYNDVNKRC